MIILELFICFTLLTNILMPDIILQKTKHIFQCMSVVQFPIRYMPYPSNEKAQQPIYF